MLATDLLIKIDNNYCFADPVMKQYVEIEELGLDLSLSNTSIGQIRQDIFEELKEKYLKTSTELGTVKESEVREIVSDFNGQVLGGHLFVYTPYCKNNNKQARIFQCPAWSC